MFDSTLCSRPLEFSTLINFGELKLLNKIVIGLLFAAVFSVTGIFFSKRWKRRLIKPGTIISVLCFSITLLMIFSIIVFQGLLLPTDTGIADAIVILGRGEPFRQERVNVAAKLWQAKKAPLIFVSGRGDAIEIIKLIEKAGIPTKIVDGEHCSLTTKENAVFTSTILNSQVNKKILLITDPPHMWRSLFLFREQGFQVIPQTSTLPVSLDSEQRAFLALKESFLLLDYFSFKNKHQMVNSKGNNTVSKLLQLAQKYSKHSK